MKLVCLTGLNCFQSCVVSVAANWGMEYEKAFARLWSETDLDYDRVHEVYTSKRLLEDLEIMGIKAGAEGCERDEQIHARLAALAEGELFIAGFDAFFVPWSPVYEAMHDPHYFIARKEADRLCCFDATYGTTYERIPLKSAFEHAFGIHSIERTAIKPLDASPTREASEILQGRGAQHELPAQIRIRAREKRGMAMLAKYAAALINNRRLFSHYLLHCGLEQAQLLNIDYFSRWSAVKNGLFKASLIAKNEHVIEDVCARLADIFDEEASIAQRIAAAAQQ